MVDRKDGEKTTTISRIILVHNGQTKGTMAVTKVELPPGLPIQTTQKSGRVRMLGADIGMLVRGDEVIPKNTSFPGISLIITREILLHHHHSLKGDASGSIPLVVLKGDPEPPRP